MANNPIFFDATGRRAIGASIVGWTAAVISLALGAAFVVSLLNVPTGARLHLPGHLTAINIPYLEKKAQAPGLVRAAARLATEARNRREELARTRRERNERGLRTRPLASILKPLPNRPLTIAFYPNWGPNGERSAYPALMNALPKLDWLMPTWFALQGPDLSLVNALDPRLLAELRAKRANLAILPTLQNSTQGKWDGAGLAKLLADKARTAALVKQIAAIVGDNKLQGITVDFEEIPDNAHGDVENFLKQLSAAFLPHGWIVVLAVSFDDDDLPYAAYARIVDYMLLMAYDQHDDTGEAGSIAAQDWFETTLDKRMRTLAPSRTIVSVGSYGYDWNGGHGDDLSFEDAVVAAHDSEATIDFDDATNNPHFSYVEDDQTKHDVWFLDAATAFNQIHASDIYRPAGYALWKLGSEDPSIWDVLGRGYGAAVPQGLRDIPISGDIDYEGQGEFLRVEADPSSGARTLEVNPNSGDIDDENYTRLPTNYVIHQFGYVPGKLALTFDDGPDPEWTPQILDILKAKHIHATFFVIGGNAEANPDLIQRIVAEGHELGNHTYTHPNLADTPTQAVALELNATQRLIQALTGRSLVLFRPPYLGDAEPGDTSDIIPVEIAQGLGYITVGEHIDPIDWALPGTDTIVARVLSGVEHPPTQDARGSAVLLHDAGGDRSQTVAALPVLIDKLRARGFQFVPASTLIGFSRDQAMPPLSPTMALLTDRVVFLTVSWAGRLLYYAFLTAIWLGVSRLFFLAGLSLWNLRRDKAAAAPPPTQTLFVSVLVPAYNEEKVIAKTVDRILESDTKDLEVIVVDDGSQDNTSEVLRAAFGTNERVTLIRVPNGGKAAALNVALGHAKGDILVALDADTQFQRDTIPRLVRWFIDPEIGAVAGNAKVGNRTNMITRWQALEYIVAQNLERRALAALGTLTVIPGAVGAWRKSALQAMGGFHSDTLAEDQDLTIGIQVKGYRVRFDSSAVAWTEAPATFSGLAKQRFRWAFGTLQCLWKYRELTFNPRYGALGMIALPQVWLFQIALTALAPLADLLLIWQLISQWIAYSQHGAEFSNTDLITVGIYYAVFIVVDLLAATDGFLMERGEDWSLLWWLPLQRFGYRQLMYYVVVRSISAAIRGAVVGWGKQERTGTVKAHS
ncbi:MAG TPA: polysaccharide deacetylase family protein [Rhizomicrobium sp.]|jgi:cellulose synthase/poly-beta-1,6-N-acetylglucosamine synthase-like glycosyltransferase/peptidoglycan/xylan/chitin deacetylase (PgdA/CDA1 family)|nr:polysaccharide deacetylase family protein [Rhizomicrobium sp.]